MKLGIVTVAQAGNRGSCEAQRLGAQRASPMKHILIASSFLFASVCNAHADPHCGDDLSPAECAQEIASIARFQAEFAARNAPYEAQEAAQEAADKAAEQQAKANRDAIEATMHALEANYDNALTNAGCPIGSSTADGTWTPALERLSAKKFKKCNAVAENAAKDDIVSGDDMDLSMKYRAEKEVRDQKAEEGACLHTSGCAVIHVISEDY